MKRFRLLLALSILSAMSGCTQYWYNPGVSFEQAQSDHQECFQGILEQSTLNSMSQADIGAMNTCMAQKGYRLVFGHELPKAADRINPVSSPYWKLNGVAGLPEPRDYPLFEY